MVIEVGNSLKLIKEKDSLPRQNYVEADGYKLTVSLFSVWLRNGKYEGWEFGDPIGSVTLEGPDVKISIGGFLRGGYFNLRADKNYFLCALTEELIKHYSRRRIRINIDPDALEELYDKAIEPYMNLSNNNNHKNPIE